MRKILRKSWAVIKINIISLLLFEFVYRVATFIIIIGLMEYGISVSLKNSNYSYLTAENFLDFLKSPFTMVFLIFLIVLMLIFLLIEVCTIFVCFQFSYNKQKIFMTDMFLLGLNRTGKFLKHGHISWILCVLFSVPFLCFHLIIREVYYIKILNYTVQTIYNHIPDKMVVMIILGLFFTFSLLFIFVLPYCILEGKKSFSGMLASVKLLLRHFFKTLGCLLITNLIVGIISIVLYFLCIMLAVFYVVMTKEPAVAYAVVLAFSQKIDMVIGIIAGAIGVVANLGVIYMLYIQYVKGNKQEKITMPAYDKELLLNKVAKRRFAAILGVLILLVELIYVSNSLLKSNKAIQNTFNITKVTAHRGGALMGPENTIGAIEKAISAMADYVEIDIQETKDGELIIMHDNNLKRTTGVNAYVWEVMYDEIKDLEVINKFGEEFVGEKIPTLQEVFEVCKGRIDINLDVKYNGRNGGIIEKIMALIETYDIANQCIISSTNYSFLKKVKEINPDIPTGYIMSMTYGSISNIEAADFFSIRWNYIDEEFVTAAHKAGKEVHSWTVNYKGNMIKMRSLSVDNIITDAPALAKEAMGEIEGSISFIELFNYVLR